MTSASHPGLKVEQVHPGLLHPAPWNPNRVSPEDAAKLDASVLRHGLFKPVVVRELEDGTLQILGGHYRVESAMRLGMPEIPIVNLGQISDERAKEITLIDNGRYGHDDATALGELLEELSGDLDLTSFMPYDKAQIEAITAACQIDLDTLGLDDSDAAPVERAVKTAKTETMMRFKVRIEDEKDLSETFKAIMTAQGFTESDQLTNAGDALVWLVREWSRLAGEA